jgi:hypothetical protein
MMNDAKQWIEAHPYATGSIVVGVLLIWLIWRNRSAAAPAPATSAGTAIDPTIAALQLQTGAQLSANQTAANLQSQQIDAQLQVDQLAAAVQSQQAQLDYQATLAQILAQSKAASDTTQAQLQLGIAQILASGAVSGSQTTLTVFGTSQLAAVQQSQQQQAQQAIDAAVPIPPAYVPQVDTTPPAPAYVPPATISYVPPATAGAAPVFLPVAPPVAPASIPVGDSAMYSPHTDYSNYQGWLPAPGTAGRPSYADLLASGQIRNCGNTLDASCSQQNTAVMDYYGI